MANESDPLDLLKNMWGKMGFNLPGMVTPTLDTEEIDKRITDLKAVEGWLKSNLGLLQMTIHGLEMQRTTLAAMRAFGEAAGNAGGEAEPAANPFANPALWSWPFAAASAATADAEPTAAPDSEATPAKPVRKPKKKTG